jgi:hypothetical protein
MKANGTAWPGVLPEFQLHTKVAKTASLQYVPNEACLLGSQSQHGGANPRKND